MGYYPFEPTRKLEDIMPLYIVAMVKVPTKDESEQGKEATIILEPTAVVAKDERAASAKATLAAAAKAPTGTTIDLTNVEVMVRPF